MSESNKREHADNRFKVPQLYKQASKIAKTVQEDGGSYRTLLYNSNRNLVGRLSKIVPLTLQHYDDCEYLLKKSKLLEKENIQPWLARVLITELMWGKKELNGDCKPVLTINAYAQILKAHSGDLYKDSEPEPEKIEVPRYVRVNTLQCTTQEAIDGFKDEGWRFVKCLSDSYDDYLEKLANLEEDQFMLDMHIDDLLVFPPHTSFIKHHAYLAGQLVLQDKSCCLPVHLMAPPSGSTVLDMCAAPGMKTSQIGACLQNNGQIYAVELNENRYNEMTNLLEHFAVDCVITMNGDAMQLHARDVPGVEYILVDPSCSGSGIIKRLDTKFSQGEDEQQRIKKLSTFQFKLLDHALNDFPNAKKVVYSTCSLNWEENEGVVCGAIHKTDQFRLVPLKGLLGDKWKHFGQHKGEIGRCCIYADPNIDRTTGFFVAVFERLKEGEKNPYFHVRDFGNKRYYNREENAEAYDDSKQKVKKKKRKKEEEET